MPAAVPQIKLSAVVKELVEAGVAGSDLVAAIERIENSAEPVRLVDAQADQRRAKDRERKRQARLRNSADTKDETEKESPPDPQKKNNLSSGPFGPDKASSSSVRSRLFNEGLSSLQRQTGKRESQCRALIGKLLKNSGDDAIKVLNSIHQAERDQIADPIAWLTRIVGPPGATNSTKRERMNAALANWAETDGQPDQKTGDRLALQRFPEC
jgi:hypothetical protein